MSDAESTVIVKFIVLESQFFWQVLPFIIIKIENNLRISQCIQTLNTVQAFNSQKSGILLHIMSCECNAVAVSHIKLFLA